MESIENGMDTGQDSDDNIIEIRDLTKRFGKKKEIVAFLRQDITLQQAGILNEKNNTVCGIACC